MSESYIIGNSDNPRQLRRRLEKARKIGVEIMQAVGRFDGYERDAQVYKASVQNFHITFAIWGDGNYGLLIAEHDRICLNALWDALTANFDNRVVVEDGCYQRLSEAWDDEQKLHLRRR